MPQALDKQEVQGIWNACVDLSTARLRIKRVGSDSGVRRSNRTVEEIMRAAFDPTDNTIRTVS